VKIVILAGGSGTRLWPASRRRRPKQFLRLAEPERSLIQETVDRILPMVSLEDILVVTGRQFARQVAQQIPGLPLENILGEPCGRGSGPAVGLAAAVIAQRWGGDIMMSLHADHHIARPDILRQALTAAAQVAGAGRIVTLGVVPTRPHTGLGHVQRGALLGEFAGLPVYAIARFVEKPDLPAATRYTESGQYYWNTGMFCWQTATILGEIERYMPELSPALAGLRPALDTPRWQSALNRVWQGLATQQIDIGVMERTSLGAVVAVDHLGWNDVGDWNSLADVRSADEAGNIVSGEFLGIDTSGCIISSTGKRLISTIGLTDMVVVETDDAILVCPRSRSQDVRRLVEKLRADKKESLL
jgi:mannose-1-phosphate guanylyltransferase